jgi:hypothetical protein
MDKHKRFKSQGCHVIVLQHVDALQQEETSGQKGATSQEEVVVLQHVDALQEKRYITITNNKGATL